MTVAKYNNTYVPTEPRRFSLSLSFSFSFPYSLILFLSLSHSFPLSRFLSPSSFHRLFQPRPSLSNSLLLRTIYLSLPWYVLYTERRQTLSSSVDFPLPRSTARAPTQPTTNLPCLACLPACLLYVSQNRN